MSRWIIMTMLGVFWVTPVFGIEIELTKIRNPFDFGKGGIYYGADGEGRGGAGKQISRLGMIVLKDEKKYAIIDGASYKIGDVIDGSKITEITMDYVQLVSPYKTWRMYVEIPEEE